MFACVCAAGLILWTGQAFGASYNIADYWPMCVGSQWHYRGVDEGHSYEHTTTASEKVTIAGNPAIKMTTSDELGYAEYFWTDRTTGFWWYGFDQMEEGVLQQYRFDPPVHTPASLSPGQQVTGKSLLYQNGIKTGTMDWSITFEKADAVIVPAGFFPDCMKLLVERTVIGDNGYHDTDSTLVWLGRNAGRVKEQSLDRSQYEELIWATVCGTNFGNVPVSLSVTSITPNSGYNNGLVNITNLAGTGFQSGATVKLTKSGQSDIVATNVVVVSSTKITCTFDLTGKATGQWNVVVTNPNGESATLTNGFTINDAASVTHDLALTAFSASPTTVSRGQTVTFSFTVKNNGNVSESDVTFRLLYGERVVGSPQSVGTLAAGESKSGTMKVRVPRRAKAGEYLITGEVVPVSGETNTANNRQTVKVTVLLIVKLL